MIKLDQLEIPNGTKVHVKDQRGIGFEFHDGKIVKVVDRKTLPPIPVDVQFEEPKGIGWLWLAAMIVLVFGFAGYLLFRVNRKQKEITQC